MMFLSPHLKYDPTKSLNPAAASLCGIAGPDLPPEVTVATLAAGQWWVYPLAWSVDSIFIGLRLTPGVPLKQSPVVEAQRSLASTIASRPEFLVPVLVHKQASSGGARWDGIAATSAKKWKELVALHHSLGGDDELEELRKVLKDKRLQAQHADPDFRTSHRAGLETQARLDRTPETAAYTSYVAKVTSKPHSARTAPSPAPEAGCWNEALASLILEVAQHPDHRKSRRQDELWAAERIVRELPGLDARNAFFEETATTMAITAAKVVTKAKDKASIDPRALPAIVQVATTKKYDGSAHLALAKTFEASKDYTEAFVALMTAAFWQAQRKRTVDTSIHGRARKLARKAKWIEIADALDEMHEVRAEMIIDGDWTAD